MNLENPGIRVQNFFFYMYINTHVHIYINIKAEHPPVSPHNFLLLLKLVTELAGLFRSRYSPHTRGTGRLALLEQNGQAGTWNVGRRRQIRVSSQGRAGSNEWKRPRLPQGGTLARQSRSPWADPVTGWEDGCTDPPGPSAARLPTHPFLPPPLRRDRPSLLKGVPVCPPGTCTLVPFGSDPQHAATGLFAHCPQSIPRLSLPLLGSPAPSPSPPRPPGRWPRPDTFFSPEPQAPTHTVLWERFPTVS